MDKTEHKAHHKDFHFDAVDENELTMKKWWKSQQPFMQPKNMQIRNLFPLFEALIIMLRTRNK